MPTFRCSADGKAWEICTSPHTFGPFADGGHRLGVQAISEGGLLDPTPTVRTVTVDTKAPNTTITGGPKGRTKDHTPRFKFKANEKDVAFQCRVDELSFRKCKSPWTTENQSNGRHTVEIRGRDAAGNIEFSPARRTFRAR